jgi:hypothetical protein
VAGRNSDNTKIREYLGWEPDTRLRDGMERTYRWIWDQFTAKYDARTARTVSVSTFSHGAKPIPGDGYNPESKFMDTWRQGIPAGYDVKAAPPAKSPVKKAKKSKSARPKARANGKARVARKGAAKKKARSRR